MSSIREKTAIALTSAIVAAGVISAVQPPSSATTQDDHVRRLQEQRVNDLADAQEREHERMRQAADAHGDAELARRVVPGEHRPPEPHIHVRLLPR